MVWGKQRSASSPSRLYCSSFLVSVLNFVTSPNSGVKVLGGFLRSEKTIFRFISSGGASFSWYFIFLLLRSRDPPPCLDVFLGDTMGQRLMRLNNVEWRRGEQLRMQVIFARMSLDEIVKYITVELKLNAKNEAHVQDRQGHGQRGHREDRHHRKIQEDTANSAEDGSGSGQDHWTGSREDHEEADLLAFVAHNVKDHGQDRSRWNRLGPKKGKEPRRIGNPPLSFREYRSQHDGCWVCYGKGNNHAHDHRQCKVYEADKKAYFAAHPEKKPKEQRIADWKAKGGDGGKGQGKGQGKGGGRGYGGGPGQD